MSFIYTYITADGSKVTYNEQISSVDSITLNCTTDLGRKLIFEITGIKPDCAITTTVSDNTYTAFSPTREHALRIEAGYEMMTLTAFDPAQKTIDQDDLFSILTDGDET